MLCYSFSIFLSLYPSFSPDIIFGDSLTRNGGLMRVWGIEPPLYEMNGPNFPILSSCSRHLSPHVHMCASAKTILFFSWFYLFFSFSSLFPFSFAQELFNLFASALVSFLHLFVWGFFFLDCCGVMWSRPPTAWARKASRKGVDSECEPKCGPV